MWAAIQMCAKDWGVPPWIVEEADIGYFWEWEFYTAKIQNQEAKRYG